jgi:glycerol-3-phosphate O-acyltransferase
MTPRFNFFFRWFARRFFGHFDLDDASVARLQELESRGSVVYVMRYASRLDYFLFNVLFAREGLRLSAFANGIGFWFYRPLLEALRALRAHRRERGRHAADEATRERDRTGAAVRAGQSMFLFLRTARLRDVLRGRRAAVEQSRHELDLLQELVATTWDGGRPVSLVPIALFWRKGPRPARRFLNLSYGAPDRPSDVAKVSSFLIAYRDLSIKMGEPIDLAGFVEQRRHEGQRALVRKVRRSILIFLYREERVVEGPTLRPRHGVQEIVLAQPAVEAAVAARAREKGSGPEAARAEAERDFREIAAHMNSTFLAVLNVLVTWLFRRLFTSIEVTGIERVADHARRHPVVLVPSHRSYFDFLILSWLFYGHYLVPPHIAARENMGFGPFGFIFRRVGAYFLRRSFDDPLYKEIFRHYVGYLVKEGFTQEFFIEGTRSRTGRTLAPRLGMVAWILEAFVASGRRDLFFVPIGITYERLVEEGAMVSELEGARKQEESVLGLVRARKVLRRRFGSVHVNFGEPLSVAEALGPGRELFQGPETAEAAEGRRALVDGLGHEIVERINWAMVANATSVAACVLLGVPRRGMLREELVRRMRDVVELLRLQEVRMTPALRADEDAFEDSIAFLVRSELIKSVKDPRGEILYYEESRRRALDVYRNFLFHFLVAPSFLARRLLGGADLAELREDLAFWLDLFYNEVFAPRSLVLDVQLDTFLGHFEKLGAVARSNGRFEPTEKGRPYLVFLAEQTRSLFEAYGVATTALLATEGVATARQLEKAAAQQFERAQLLGEVLRREAWNPVTFRNALALLEARGVLARVSREGKGESGYLHGPRFDELPALRERLAAALAAR